MSAVDVAVTTVDGSDTLAAAYTYIEPATGTGTGTGASSSGGGPTLTPKNIYLVRIGLPDEPAEDAPPGEAVAGGWPVSDALVFRMDARVLDFNNLDTVDLITDLSEAGNDADDNNQATYISSAINSRPAVRLGSATKAGIGFNEPISFPANASMTFVQLIRPTDFVGPNPGIWRGKTGADSSGPDFMIFSGASRRPWIRWGGTSILSPGSGYQVPVDEDVFLVWRVSDNNFADFWSNGVKVHESTHSESTAGFELGDIGWQSLGTDRVDARYGELAIFERAITDDEIQEIYDYLQPIWLPL